MAEYIDDDLLAEAMEDGISAGMDAKALNTLARQVIQGSIAQHNMALRAANTRDAKARQERDQAMADRDQLLAFAGPAEEETGPGTRNFPITYGTGPKGVPTWNNLGWIANEPKDFSSLDNRPNQRALAERYNRSALQELGAPGANGEGVASGPGRDPFRPPSAIIAQHQANVIKNQNNLRKMLDMSQLMARMKIPAQIQDLVLYQMFPEAARRKLEEDLARLREKEAIEGPRKDASLDARLDKNDLDAEYKRENVRLRRSTEFNRSVAAYEKLKEIYETAKRRGGYSPEQLEGMSRKMLDAEFNLIMNSDAFMGNEPAPFGLPKQTHDPYAGVTGAGTAPSQYDDPDWWKKEVPAKTTPAPTGREAAFNRLRDEEAAKRSKTSAPAALPPPTASSAPRVVKNPDGTYTHPGFENSPTKTKIGDIPGAARKFYQQGNTKFTKEKIR